MGSMSSLRSTWEELRFVSNFKFLRSASLALVAFIGFVVFSGGPAWAQSKFCPPTIPLIDGRTGNPT